MKRRLINILRNRAPRVARRSEMVNKFGWVRTPDVRNSSFPMRSVKVDDEARHYRFWMTHKDTVLDQVGPRCTAFGMKHLLMMHPVVNAHRAEYDFDPFKAYDRAQQIDEWAGEGYDGTSTNAIMKVAREMGLISGWQWAWTIDPVIHHILNIGPVAFGTVWYSKMTYPDDHGYIHPAGAVEGGHFYVVDYVHTRNKNPDGSIGRFGLLNSWGRGWGNDGRAWLTFDEASELLSGDGEAAAPIEMRVR